MTTAPVSHVYVDPTVIMNILDHHTRKGEKQSCVYGAIYGVARNDVIEIRQCLPIPQEESAGAITISLGMWEEMAKIYRKVHLATFVGWYSTLCQPGDTLVDDVISKKATAHCLRLVLDGDLKQGGLRIRVLTATEVTLFSSTHRVYVHVPFDIRPCSPVQSFAIQSIVGSEFPELATSSFEGATPLHKLMNEIDVFTKFLETKGQTLPAETVFAIQRALRAVPRLSSEDSAALFENTIQDVAATKYFMKEIGVQITLIERLLSLIQV